MRKDRELRLPRRAAAVLAALLLVACGKEGGPTGAATGGAAGFEERAESAGIRFRMDFLPDEQGATFKINLYDHGAGVTLGDYDGDGDDDIYFLNQLGPNVLYRNNGDGTFTDVTKEAGPLALEDRVCVSAAFNDIDNDGDQDLFVTSSRGGNVLFRNQGGGKFVDDTRESGVTYVGHSQGVTFFDGDGDGDLDLLVANTARWTTEAYHPNPGYYEGVTDLETLVQSPIEYNIYYRNDGKGKFTEATADSGLYGIGWGGDTAAFDFDEDGDQDLFVANMFGGSLLYRNDGKGKFEEVTREVLVRTPWGAVAAKTLDFDRDGRLDLLVTDMHSDMWPPWDFDLKKVEPGRKYKRFYGRLMEEPGFEASREETFAEMTKIRYGAVLLGSALYHNLGGGRYEEVSEKANAETFWPWAIASGDYDNDSYEDVYIPSGMGFPYGYWPSALLHNNGDGTFTNIAKTAGIDPPPGGDFLNLRIEGRDAPRSSRSASVADLDGDGRLDIVVNNFNDRAFLFMNRWPKRDYVAFRLEGRTGSRDAVGAVVRLYAGKVVMVRQVQAAGGYLAQSSKTVHFGLGNVGKIDRCEILWPGGRRQTLPSPEINRVHRIVEPGP